MVKKMARYVRSKRKLRTGHPEAEKGGTVMADVKVYGAPWCPDCKRAKKFLGEQRIAYDWTDIDQDPRPRV